MQICLSQCVTVLNFTHKTQTNLTWIIQTLVLQLIFLQNPTTGYTSLTLSKPILIRITRQTSSKRLAMQLLRRKKTTQDRKLCRFFYLMALDCIHLVKCCYKHSIVHMILLRKNTEQKSKMIKIKPSQIGLMVSGITNSFLKEWVQFMVDLPRIFCFTNFLST